MLHRALLSKRTDCSFHRTMWVTTPFSGQLEGNHSHFNLSRKARALSTSWFPSGLIRTVGFMLALPKFKCAPTATQPNLASRLILCQRIHMHEVSFSLLCWTL